MSKDTPARHRLAALVLLGAAAMLLGGAVAGARPSGAGPTIRSSLDGKAVLPHRIRWIAYPSFPVNYPGVEFLIDGRVIFANRLPPFAFSSSKQRGQMPCVKLASEWAQM